jgi:hypothetical protein
VYVAAYAGHVRKCFKFSSERELEWATTVPLPAPVQGGRIELEVDSLGNAYLVDGPLSVVNDYRYPPVGQAMAKVNVAGAVEWTTSFSSSTMPKIQIGSSNAIYVYTRPFDSQRAWSVAKYDSNGVGRWKRTRPVPYSSFANLRAMLVLNAGEVWVASQNLDVYKFEDHESESEKAVTVRLEQLNDQTRLVLRPNLAGAIAERVCWRGNGRDLPESGGQYRLSNPSQCSWAYSAEIDTAKAVLVTPDYSFGPFTQITNLWKAPGGVFFSLQSWVPGRGVIQQSPDLRNWEEVLTPQWSGNQISIPNFPPQQQMFYRAVRDSQRHDGTSH